MKIRPAKIFSPSSDGGSPRAFTLIEMIGVLAVLAILAAVLLPALIKETDKIVSDQETATLQSFANALQNNILRTRVIPDNSTWVATLTNELGMSSSLVSSNARNRTRVFVIDTNGFYPLLVSAPYTQTSAGTNALPASPRFCLVSSLGGNLPAALISRPATAVFNDLWSTAAGSLPTNAMWSGWGNGGDLYIQRLNLAPNFLRLVLYTNNSTAGYASYALDANATNTVPSGGVTLYVIQNSVLTLYSNGVADSQQVLKSDISFAYDQNIWRASLGPIYTLPDYSSSINAFANSPMPPGATNGAPYTPSKVTADMISYMSNYINWANEGGFSHASANYLATFNAYSNMMYDVTNLVNAAHP